MKPLFINTPKAVELKAKKYQLPYTFIENKSIVEFKHLFEFKDFVLSEFNSLSSSLNEQDFLEYKIDYNRFFLVFDHNEEYLTTDYVHLMIVSPSGEAVTVLNYYGKDTYERTKMKPMGFLELLSATKEPVQSMKVITEYKISYKTKEYLQLINNIIEGKGSKRNKISAIKSFLKLNPIMSEHLTKKHRDFIDAI